jgi:hypothetical protein
MNATIELVHIGPTGPEHDLLLDDVRSVKADGTSKRIGFLPRIPDAVLRFVVPLSEEEIQFALNAVKELRAKDGLTVADRTLRQMTPQQLAVALKKGGKR